MLKNILLSLILIFAGIVIGRLTIKYTEKVVYVKGDTIYETIEKLVPYEIKVYQPPPDIDTTLIIDEYFKKKEYKEILFDNDTIGKLTVNSVIQFNEIQSLSYQFSPIHKRIIEYRKKVYTPFVMSSINFFGQFSIGAGLYKNNFGLGLKYTTDFNENKKGVGISVYYRF
jgi:hypothetical protein